MATSYDHMRCGHCGIEFMVPDYWLADKRETKATFYCPNGHSRVFRESEADQLRRERDRLKQNEARLLDEQARLVRLCDQAEREARRLKKRAAQAQCPCCTKTFGNLRAHMARAHPEFVAEGAKIPGEPLMIEGPRP